MKKVLMIQNIHQSGIDLLKKRKDFKFEIIENLDIENLKKKLTDVDAVSLKTLKFDEELINISKKLKIISRHGVGYDNVNTAVVKNNGIQLTITAKANAVSVAEHVIFMILNISKRKNMYHDTVKSGKFTERSKLPKTIELWKKNILIAGFGRIGKSLIKRCLGFEMNVFVYDPFIPEKEIKYYGGTKVEDFSQAVKDMDIISLHMPLNEKTKNIINQNLLKSMKKNCILINAARGGLINETDLNEALNRGDIFGAGLDVFEKEPPEKNNLLLKNDKAFFSPHVATFTEECIERMGRETIQNIIDFFDGKLDKSMIVKL